MTVNFPNMGEGNFFSDNNKFDNNQQENGQSNKEN